MQANLPKIMAIALLLVPFELYLLYTTILFHYIPLSNFCIYNQILFFGGNIIKYFTRRLKYDNTNYRQYHLKPS